MNESEIGFRPETPAKSKSNFCDVAKIQIPDHFPFHRELRLKLDRLSLEDTEGYCDEGCNCANGPRSSILEEADFDPAGFPPHEFGFAIQMKRYIRLLKLTHQP